MSRPTRFLTYFLEEMQMVKQILIGILAGAAITSGCAARWVNTPVLNEKNTRVFLESRQKGAETVAQHFHHPLQMDANTLARILSHMAYIEKIGMVEKAFKSETPQPVFQPDEIARLAPAIAEALAKANPNQRVRFQSLNRGGGLIFASRRITEGVVFADAPDQLNIAFNIINHELSADAPDEIPDEYQFNEPTEVTSPWTSLASLPPYARFHPAPDGTPSQMWMVADLKAFQNMPPSPAPPAATSSTSTPMPPYPEKKADQAPAEAPCLEPSDKTIPHPASNLPHDPSTDERQAVKNKLKLLKELFEDGLITPAEYEAEKKKILENIK